MAVRKADAVWNGTLREGDGRIKSESGAIEVKYSFKTRFENEPGTNPEELIAAAHAGCFSMALAAGLVKAGQKPERIATTAAVTLDNVGGGFEITKIHLTTTGKVPGISDAAFREAAQAAKSGCPVSKALKAVEITLDAKLA